MVNAGIKQKKKQKIRIENDRESRYLIYLERNHKLWGFYNDSYKLWNRINNNKVLDEIYQTYSDNGSQRILSDKFDYLIGKMKGHGLIKE